jgi:16S rRNA pseudouridine516 synthase
MFAAVGNHVETLHRSRVGGLALGNLPIGEWRELDANDVGQLFARPLPNPPPATGGGDQE